MCSEFLTPSTRAPHLLLILATGNYSVRLNRFIHRNKLRRGPRSKRKCKKYSYSLLIILSQMARFFHYTLKKFAYVRKK